MAASGNVQEFPRMSTEHWERTKQILEEALRIVPEQRPAHLDLVCGADSELRAEVAGENHCPGVCLLTTPSLILECGHCPYSRHGNEWPKWNGSAKPKASKRKNINQNVIRSEFLSGRQLCITPRRDFLPAVILVVRQRRSV